MSRRHAAGLRMVLDAPASRQRSGSYEHRAARLALELDGTRRQTDERGSNRDVEEVRSLLKTFDQELALALLLRRQHGNVVGRAQLAVRTTLDDLNRRLDTDAPGGIDARQPQRIVAGLIERPGHAVESFREHDGSRHVLQIEPRSIRGDVGHQQQRRKELVQKGHVARDDDETGDRRGVEPRIVVVASTGKNGSAATRN